MTTPKTSRLEQRGVPLAAQTAVSIEQSSRLDPLVDAMERLTSSLDAPEVGAALRGEWLGHALHPSLTDLPMGLWTAATVLDLVGGKGSRPAARRLVGIGLITAAPTGLTGWAEWRRSDRPAKRVGVVHALLNVAAVGIYVGSWRARRRQQHLRGAVLALAGAGTVSAAGYLGGHLVTVRKVSSYHPGLGTEATQGGATTIPASGGPSTRSAWVTSDDVVRAIVAQHSRIASLIQPITTAPVEQRAALVRDLLAYLAGHEAVEQELIHPLVPVAGGQEVGLERAREEEGMAQQAERLEQLGPESPFFTTQLGLLEEALTYHSNAEETDELPHVADILGLDQARAALVVRSLSQQEAAAAKRRGSFADMLEEARAEVRELAASAD